MGELMNHYEMFLYYTAKVWGLAPFTWANNRAHIGSSVQLINPTILGILCIFQSIIAVVKRSYYVGYEGKTAMTYVSDMLSIQLGNLGGGLFVITFAVKRRKIVGIINALKKLDGRLRAFGVQQDYEKYFKSRLIPIVSISCVTMMVAYGANVNYLIKTDQLFIFWSSLSMISSTWITLIQYHGIFVFLIAMDFLRKHYRQLNHLFSNVCTEIDIVRTQYFRNLILPTTERRNRNCIHLVPRGDLKPLDRLKNVEELYDELREITDNAMDVFGIPIMGSLAFFFAALLNIFYFIYVGAATSTNVNYPGSILVNNFFWIIFTFLELFAIAATCSSLQQTANFTIVIIHRMWLKYHPVELKDEIQMLSLQLLQRPLTISAFGFFSLDYSYLYKIFCAVVAYFIIMIQLDTSKLEPSHITNSTSNVTTM